MLNDEKEKKDCQRPLERVLKGHTPSRRPVWFMRQAGRYLPEYRQVRSRHENFLDFCYTPKSASEVTLQPLKRFDLDAAIIFSDILVIPDLYGRRVQFISGEGPVLDPLREEKSLAILKKEKISDKVQKIFETINKTRAVLDKKISLIGFCGAPWTVACYMVEGKSNPEHLWIKKAAYQEEIWFLDLIKWLSEVSVDYLSGQIEAGADVIQIFDTWAIDLSEDLREKFCYSPISYIVSEIKKKYPHIPVIGFARGLGEAHTEFAEKTGVDGCGIESGVRMEWAYKTLSEKCAVQGNLDPFCLSAGGKNLDQAVRRIIQTIPKERHIFNVGHGIRPETPPEHVSRVLEIIRGDAFL